MIRPITRTFPLLLILLVAAACGAREPDASQFKGTWLPTAVPVPDVELVDANGDAVSLSDFQNEIVLLYFGYTFCPDICPTTMAELSQVQRQLDDNGQKIQVVMVTVDPERDTPEKLAEYLAHFHSDFIGLSGPKEAIDAAGAEFGLYYVRNESSEAAGYLVDHTARVFVIDADGNYKLSFSYGTPVEDIIHDLRLLMPGI